MKKVVLPTAVLFLLSLAGFARAEQSAFGLVQTWLTYTAYTNSNGDSLDTDDDGINDAVYEDASQLGFGVKRARLGWKYSDGDFFAMFQGDATGGELALLDGVVGMKVNDMLTLQAGRFIGVGSQAGGLTSSTKIDLIERSIIGRRWAAGTVGSDYRIVGLMATVATSDMLKFKAQVHNGTGTKPGLLPSSNTHSGGGDLADDGFAPQMDFGVYANPMDGLKVGFTYGLPNENLNTTGSMTAFAYFGTPAFFLKFDYASLDDRGSDWDDDDDNVTSMGYAALGAYNVNERVQVLGRYEAWDADTDLSNDQGDYQTRNVTVGLNYFVNPDAKYDQVFKLAFTRRMDEMPAGVDIADPNLFMAMWQIYVH